MMPNRALPRLDAEWFTIDRPVLLAIAHELKQPRPRADAAHIAQSTGLPLGDVIAAGYRLRERYIGIDDISTYDGRDWIARRLTEDGLREVGIWPDEETVADRLIAALAQAEQAAGDTEKPKVRAALDAFRGMSRDLMVEVAGAFLSGRLQP